MYGEKLEKLDTLHIKWQFPNVAIFGGKSELVEQQGS